MLTLLNVQIHNNNPIDINYIQSCYGVCIYYER